MALLLSTPRRQWQGPDPSATYVVPADASGMLLVRPRIDDGDFTDPAKSIFMRIYRLDVPSQTWVVVVATRWFGTPGADHADPSEHPLLSVNIEPLRGQQIRGEIDIPSRMRVGFDVELI